LTDQLNLDWLELVATLGHFGLVAGNVLDDGAFVRLAGRKAGSAFAPVFELFIRGELQPAPFFGRLMAAAARALQDGPHLAVVAHRAERFGGR